MLDARRLDAAGSGANSNRLVWVEPAAEPTIAAAFGRMSERIKVLRAAGVQVDPRHQLCLFHLPVGFNAIE